MNQGALCSTAQKFGQVDIDNKPVAFDDIGLRLRHRLVSGAARPEGRSCAR
jgi:hypothetical protein